MESAPEKTALFGLGAVKDGLSPKRRSNAVVMKRGPAEEAVVIVKPGAGDPAVTLVRVNHQVSDRRLEVKGGTRKRSWALM